MGPHGKGRESWLKIATNVDRGKEMKRPRTISPSASQPSEKKKGKRQKTKNWKITDLNGQGKEMEGN